MGFKKMAKTDKNKCQIYPVKNITQGNNSKKMHLLSTGYVKPFLFRVNIFFCYFLQLNSLILSFFKSRLQGFLKMIKQLVWIRLISILMKLETHGETTCFFLHVQ